MSLLRAVTSGLRSLFRKQDVEQELDDELRHYVEMAVRDKMQSGVSRQVAERAVRIEMGGVEPTKERVRSGGWEAGVATLWQDVRYGIRGLSRAPGFAAIAITTLALGIGATTAMFSVVNAVLLRPLPYRDPGRLALIWTDDARRGLHREATAFRTISDWRETSRMFSEIAYYSTERVAAMTNDASSGGAQRTRNALVSGNLFSLLGVAAQTGRVISLADEDNREPVAVISYSAWQRWFGGATDVVGKTLIVPSKNGPATFTVVGVMPQSFYFPDKLTEVWTPATTYWRFGRESSERFPSWARRWTAIARLAPDVSLATARADLTRIGTRLAAIHTTDIPDFPGFATTVVPILDFVTGTNIQSALWLLLGAVGLVLLVACANIANLVSARGATRQQELAVRRALGAGRGRLIRQLVAESLVLASIGGAIGVLIATWGTRVLSAAAAAYVPRIDEISVDARVLAFALLTSIVSGVLFGLAPALRVSKTDASDVLKEGGHSTGGLHVRRGRGMLIVAECAVAIVLLAGAGLLLRSLGRLQGVEPGFDPSSVAVVRFELPSEAAPSAEERTQTSQIAPMRARAHAQQMDELLARVQTLPGVEQVGFTDDLFVAGQGNESITIPGRATDSIAGELNQGAVSPGFFPVLRVPLKRGRYPTREDLNQRIRAMWTGVVTHLSLAEKERLAVPEPVVVNEAFVRRFFPNEDPIGKRFCIDPTNKTYWYEIVGVVGDMHRGGLERPAIPEYYSPHLPSAFSRADLLVRTKGDPLVLAPMLRQAIAGVIPGVTVVSVSTVEGQLGAFTAQRRFQTWLLASFAAFALVLAAVGIYGVVHYAVSERTREIGVRVALGATPGDVLGLVVGDGLRMPAIGIAIGLVASFALTRVISHLLFGIGPTDPITFAGVGVVLTVVAAAACWIPARRAARVDPVRALKAE